MTSEEHSGLILAFTRVLYVNGQATDQVVAAGRRLGDKLGLRADLLARWGELQLSPVGGGTTPISDVAADPTGVNMDRVASAMQAVAEIEAGRLSPDEARKRIDTIANARPAPTWLFALAAAVGAVALAIIFGIRHEPAALDLRERGRGRRASPWYRQSEHEHLHSTVLRRTACGSHWRAGGALSIEHGAAVGRGLPLYGACAGSALSQWCD
jgi:hypothetical protein